MLFLILVTSYSLKYVYPRVCLLMLHSFVAAWVFCVLFTQPVQMSM
jgi:hypothetical protein